MATTSNGLSRLREAGAAAALAAAALILVPRAFEAEAESSRATTPAPASLPMPMRAQVFETVAQAPHAAPAAPRSLTSAEALMQALADAAPGARDLVLEQLLPLLVDANPAAAVRFAEDETDPFLRETAQRIIAQRWTLLAPQAAADWALSLAEPDERDRALEQVARSLGSADPAAGLRLLERRVHAEPLDAAVAGVLISWTAHDVIAVIDWIESQPPGAARDEITRRLVFHLATIDRERAHRLVERLL